MVSSPASPSLDDDSLRVLGVCALLLLFFSLVVWVLNPTQERPSYSSLEWKQPPPRGGRSLESGGEVGGSAFFFQ